MEEINTATPESVTAEASKNPIYDFLKKNNLTTKDEKSFVKEYSNPEKVRELHKFFSDNELTTKDFDSFYTDNFGGEKKNSGQNQGLQTGGQGSSLGLPPSQITKPNDLLNQGGSFTIQPTENIKQPAAKKKSQFDFDNMKLPFATNEKTQRQIWNANPTEVAKSERAKAKLVEDTNAAIVKKQETEWKAQHGDGYLSGVGLGLKYATSSILKGASAVVPAMVYASDRVNKALTGQPLLDEEEKNFVIDNTTKGAELGLNPEYRGSDKVMGAVGGFMEFVPAMLAAESTAGASFYLNGVGNAYKEVQQLKKEGKKFDNGAEDLYIQGKGVTDYFLMTMLNAHSLFPTLPSTLRNVASREASIDALKTLTKSGEPLTSEALVSAFKDSALKMSDQIKNKGVPFLKDLAKGYAKTAGDLSALSASDALLKKASNAVSGDENFTVENGSVGDNIAHILTVDAPLFAAMGARNNVGMLFDKSPVRNEVMESLKQDSSPETVAALKEAVVQQGAERQWTQDDIDGTINGIDRLATASTKIPKTLSEKKYNEALDIVVGKQNLTEQLSRVKEANKSVDPALADIGTPEEQALTAKLEQSDDKLREIVTGKKVKYTQDEETGEYFKQLGGDGKLEPITKERFDLEQVEQESRDVAEGERAVEELQQYIEQADEVREQHERLAEQETDPAEKAELEDIANKARQTSNDAKAELEGLKPTDNTVESENKPVSAQTDSSMSEVAQNRNKDVFEDSTPFGDVVGKSGSDADISSYKDVNGIGVAQYKNKKNGLVDVVLTGKSQDNYVGYIRVYEKGEPTNRFTSKMENKNGTKEEFKTMLSEAQKLLPAGHEYTESTSISTDGLKIYDQQLSRGYEVLKDAEGNPVTNKVTLNIGSKVNDLGVDLRTPDFSNIRVMNEGDFVKVKNALLGVAKNLGIKESDITLRRNTVEIELPVLKHKSKADEIEQPLPEKENVVTQTVSPERNKEVLKKAEDDLAALKQVTNKVAKYDASMRRLTDAKNKGEVSQAEFDTLKKRFDEVLGDSAPTIKAENLNAEETKQMEAELANDDLTIKDFIEHEKVQSETTDVPEVVQPTGNDTRADGSENKGSERVETQKQPTSDRAETKVTDDFKNLIHKNIQSEEVANTLNNVERETGRTLDAKEKEYQTTKRVEAIQHGSEVVEQAKVEFGDDYANKLINYLQEDKTVSVENRSLITIMLELDLERRIIEEPQNKVELNKQLKLVRDISTAQQRSAAIATGYGILRQIARVGYDVSQATNEFFSSAERESRSKVVKSIEADADTINKEAERLAQDATDTITPDIEQAISQGVEARLQEIYEKMPTKRRQQADKAIDALTKIQKKLRGRAYDATIGVPVAIIDAGITTIKGAIRAGVTVADAIELGINKIKEAYGKKWDKEADFRKDMLDGFADEKVDINTGKKAVAPKTSADRLADAKDRTKKRIAEIKDEIANKQRQMKAQNKVKPDQELLALQSEEKALIALRDKYLPKPADPNLDAKKIDAISKRIMTEIEDINRQIKKGEKDDIDAGRDPYDTPELTKLKAERKARLDILEQIDPTPKEFIKNALIEKGYGREITVTRNEVDANGNEVLDANGVPNKVKEKTMILDWKKLAGEEGSIDRMQRNVEEVLKGKGYSDADISRIQNGFTDEYNSLRASIIEKSLNELNNRNTPKDAPDVKTSAKRLAELYNFGLFERESDTYDYLLNNAVGLSGIGQEAFFQAKVVAKALADLYQTKVDGRTVSEFGLKHAVRNLNQQIEALLSKVAWEQSNGTFKAATIVKEYMGMAQRGMLQSVKQFVENPLSGAIQRVFSNIGFSFDKVDTKALSSNRSRIARAIYEDTVRNGGLAYGEVTTPFITRSRTEEWLNKQSTNRVYHTILSSFLGKAYLEGADSMHKSALTEKYFTYNLIKVLSDPNNPNRMNKQDAIDYVSNSLTGVKFRDAQDTAQQIINKANADAGKMVIPDNKQSATRIAADLIKDGLVQDKKITIEEIEAAYKAAYTAAGYDLGHEANNPISAMVSNASAGIETKIQKAIKEKKWNEAAAYTFTSIISRNILNPFVGGGTNWLVLTLQKSGFDFISPLADYAKRKDNRLDLTTEAGIKNIEKSLMTNLKSKNTNTRVLVGAMASLLTYAAVRSTGADDDISKWLKKEKWAAKYFKVISPQMLVLMLSIKDKKMSDYFAQLLNIKVGSFDEGKKLVSGVKELTSGTDEGANKGSGIVGDLIGSRLSTPLIPWRFTRDLQNIGRGLRGKDLITVDYNTSGFFNGYYKGGLIDYLGLRPEGVNNKRLTPAEMDKLIKDAVQKMNNKKE